MPKEKKPIQEIPEEENIITPDEFQELESKEKKRKLGGIFSKSKDKTLPQKRSLPETKGKSDSDDVVIAVEKIQAKLETIEGLRQATEEKISHISEEIGELRSAILEKEKTFNQVETGFEKVKEIFQELQPKKIRDDLERKEDAIEKLGAKVESFDTKITDLKKNMAEVLGIMDNIKDLKNVIAVSANISRKMGKIDDDKKDIAKIAAKVESMFSEITEKMTEFHDYREKIEFSSESMHDIMKSMDMLEVRVENALTKEDMKKIDDRLEQMEADLSDKIQIIRDIVDDLVTSLKKGGVKDLLREAGKTRIDEINKKFSEIEGYGRSLKETRNELAKLKGEKDKEIGTLISEIEKLRHSSKASPLYDKKDTGRKSKARPADLADEEKSALNPAPQPAQDEAEAENAMYPEQQQDIVYMLQQCHSQIDSGNVEAAKSLYTQILALYEQSKDSPEAEQLYGSIKRLYYRLQVYA